MIVALSVDPRALTFVLAAAAFRCTNRQGQYNAGSLSGPVDALDLVPAFVDLTSLLLLSVDACSSTSCVRQHDQLPVVARAVGWYVGLAGLPLDLRGDQL